jgi:hypothetical protein
MRTLLAGLKARVRSLLNPRWEQEEPDVTTPEVIARWVDTHRHPEGR